LRELEHQKSLTTTSDFIEAVRSQYPDGVDAVPTTVGGDTKYRSIQTIEGDWYGISSEERTTPERDIQRTMFYARADTKSLDATRPIWMVNSNLC